MMSRTLFLFTLAVLCLSSSLSAQEPNTKNPAPESLRIQMEYQFQRVKLLKARLELVKQAQQVEVDQAKLRVEAKKIEQEALQSRIKAAEAQMQVANRNLERSKQLHERGAVTESDLGKARHEQIQAESEYQTAKATAEHNKQAVSSEELELKRLELQGAIRVNEIQLEILEGEFRIKELKLNLQRQ